MGNRRQAREHALKLLFQIEFTSQGAGESPLPESGLPKILPAYWDENDVSEEIRQFTEELCAGALKNLAQIDASLESHSTNWKLSRMASVDRNLLRLATFELLFEKEIPASVTINEALEISKKYGNEESASFINGILDKIAHEQ